MYQPKTGVACGCKRGQQRDNCPACEGTGQRIDFAAIRAMVTPTTVSPSDARRDWIKWLSGYGAGKFYDAFLRNAQGAEGKCQYCGEAICLDIVEGGGIADWGNDGDYGCIASPETTEEGCGSHLPFGAQGWDK